jgi:hypothetical protein
VLWEPMGKERVREGVCGVIYWRGAFGTVVGTVVASWARIGRASGGVVGLGPGVRGALVYGRMQVAGGGKADAPFCPVSSMRRCSTVGMVS